MVDCWRMFNFVHSTESAKQHGAVLVVNSIHRRDVAASRQLANQKVNSGLENRN